MPKASQPAAAWSIDKVKNRYHKHFISTTIPIGILVEIKNLFPYNGAMHWHTLARVILSHLAEAGPIVIDMLIPPHHKSRAARALLGLDRRRYASRAAAKHSFSTILGRLRREGLVARTGARKNAVWALTAKGRAVLRDVKPAEPKKIYVVPPADGMIRLVSFDIPEKMRRHRQWLRAELIACGFEPLHKSVLMGKRPLPEDLIAEFEARELTEYIHIVAIQKSGTLTREA